MGGMVQNKNQKAVWKASRRENAKGKSSFDVDLGNILLDKALRAQATEAPKKKK